MRRVICAVLLCAAMPAFAGAQETPESTDGAPAEERRIAAGVSAAGVDLSNLTIPEATAKLRSELGPRMARDLVVVSAGRTFRLTPARARFAFDAELTAKRAYYAGRDAGPGTAPEGGGTPAALEVELAVRHARAATRAFAASVDRAVSIAPRNARVRITVRRIMRARAKAGRSLDSRALAAALDAAFADPRAARLVRPRMRRVAAAVNANDLRARYRTVVTIDRRMLRLRLFKNLRLRKAYGIAIGAAGFDTPSGLFRIQSRQVNPAWHAPNKAWAGSYAGKTVPGGAPNNPLKARWLGVSGSVGIHGTAEEWSIGTRASHGCIRMRVRDVVDLYPRVPLGTPVLIR